MKSMLKDAVILFVITCVSGALLGLVYQVTKEPIARQQLQAKMEACEEVFEAADAFETISESPDLSPETLSAFVKGQGYNADINEISAALDKNKEVLGHVITVTDHEGYGGDIQFSVGITNEGCINGISILSIAETAGLGMRAEEVLKPQFADKTVQKFSYTKTGKTSDDQIDAISGATITTNAVVNGVNAALAVNSEYLALTGNTEE